MNSSVTSTDGFAISSNKKAKPLRSCSMARGLAPLRVTLLSAALILVSIAAFTASIRADETVTTTVTATPTAGSEVPVVYVQMLEFLLLLVLVVATLIAIFLIRLYRKTRF